MQNLLITSNSLHLQQLLLLLHWFLLLQNIPIQAQEIFLYCPVDSSNNYTSGSQFETNLKTHLLPSLVNSGSINGFFNTSSGNDPNSTVYGLVQCRGDISMDKCRTCLNNSSVLIIQKCPNRKDVAIRLEFCVLRYSNIRFFSQVDSGFRVIVMYSGNVTGDPTVYSYLLGGLMSNLSSMAASTPSKFETGSVQYYDFNKIFGMVQCTQDLSSTACFNCLQDMIGTIPSCCSGNIGGHILTKSCFVRVQYELLPPPPPPPPPNFPPPPIVQGSPPPSDVAGRRKGSTTNVVAIVVPSIISALLLFAVCVCFLKRKKTIKSVAVHIVFEDVDEIQSADSLQFNLSTIRVATNNFSDANKLGRGGFGYVYKGTLQDGQEIAVKRLSRNSGQGEQEFKNEVVLIVKLQHRNLVRLLGFCLDGEEKLLVYEYMLNASLDKFIFDPIKRTYLDWEIRYKIIGGIARGLLYLHEDSRLKIIHRDLKASNILLDADMNPKISDFGMARLFVVDQTESSTNRIVGTYGYMAPEYAMCGQFSVKSDVFSFGILVLEILSGRRNNSFYGSERAQNLLSYAWRHWKEGTAIELLDPTLRENYSRIEVMIRCIQIGLLCVQEDVDDRPTMASIVNKLNNYSVPLRSPSSPPAFFVNSREEQTMRLRECENLTINEASITELYPR